MTKGAWWVVVLLATGCSDKGQSGTQVGTAGGVVTASNGTSVSIPQGALGGGVSITIEVSSESVPGGIGTVYKLGPEGQTFATPITITLDFSPDRLPMGKTVSDVVIRTAPAGSSEFTSLETLQFDSTHMSGFTTHFSIFGAAVLDGAAADGGTVSDGGACTPIGQTCLDAVVCCSGGACLSGSCVAPPICVAGQTACNGSCVSTATDANNCGSCGHRCSTPTPVCISGACSPPAA